MPAGAQKAKIVRPTRSRSPSASRRRPASRRPLTHVPFCERPSSETVHSPARSSSSACRRDISGSHGTEMSASSRRPSVMLRVRSASEKMCWRPVVVAVDEERRADPLGGPAGLQFLLSRLAKGEWRLHRPSLHDAQSPEKMFSSETKMLTIETKMPVASQIVSRSVPCLRR